MPLITRRSSTRALPRVSVGRCGLIFENCAFVSQNWSRLIYASFSEAVNHATTLVPTLLWVQTLGVHPCHCRLRNATLFPKADLHHSSTFTFLGTGCFILEGGDDE